MDPVLTCNQEAIGEVELQPPPHAPSGATIMVPGSKSYTNRALLLAAMAEGTTVLRNILRSDDSAWCLDVLTRLSVKFTIDPADPTTLVVEGTAGHFTSASLYMGAAGTIARFLPGLLAVNGVRGAAAAWTLDGSRRLRERPIAPLVEAWRQLGAHIRYVGPEGMLPIEVLSLTGGIRGGEVTMSGAVSSQFISGLLLAAPYAREGVTICLSDSIVQLAYVEMTIDLMRRFGVHVEVSDTFDRFHVAPGQRYLAQDIQLESDASTCGYFLAYAAVTGGHIHLAGLDPATKQPDIGLLSILERMGCRVECSEGADEGIDLWGPQTLKGGFTVSLRELSDQTLTIAALAPFADGPITITGVEHIRQHECDRIRAMCESLTRLGIEVDEYPDGLKIVPSRPQPAVLDTYDDHRMAMSLALVGAKVGGIRLRDPGCVAKTCPDYWERMQQLGLIVRRLA
ncbi:3-phosphoshikimate 1-carboxyvinyltransferase [Paenibacillus koleovorans]|uniref:3-phosphoshikimate 1-carboxyvinyltransferase n=1 Tax=Paenibacillus koleovorans TaxID=121608 RepID=UPI000FD71D8D|nr:3-phosphoshikimate 1-carboxyvinyltransferase [Paenibacillus koleovorans]